MQKIVITCVHNFFVLCIPFKDRISYTHGVGNMSYYVDVRSQSLSNLISAPQLMLKCIFDKDIVLNDK